MSKRLMFLLGAVCILLIVVGYINLSWSPDVTAATPSNSTTGDNKEATTDNTSTNSTTNGSSETSTNNSTETTAEDNTTNNSTTNDTTGATTKPASETDNSPNDTTSDSSTTTKPETPQPNQEDHEDEEDYTWDSEVTTITLNTDSISADEENGTTINGTTLTITSAGTYNISGTLEDGQIIVDTNDEETVKLVLNGVNISSTTNAPVYVENAEKTVIILADNTENYLTDNKNNEDNGTLASRDDLTIYGNGALTVRGNANDAIRSNDGLIIKSGNITVNSVDDGIRGKDYLVIKGGTITINSVGDGLKSDNDEEEDRGYISIEGGTIEVTSTRGDAISAKTDLLVTGGTFTLKSGGGSTAHADKDVSTKGLKAGVFMIIDAGSFTIDSFDDAIHSNHKIFINDGTYQLASGNDSIHAETSIEINSGTIIAQSYEGLESKIITINSGHIELVTSDDGINAVNTTYTAPQQGGWGVGDFGPPGDYYVYINGGFIYIDSGGDGIDTNGHIEMSDGFVIINGPVSGHMMDVNGAIDYGYGTFKLTGGTLVAVGSSGMAQAPSPEKSTQYSVLVNFNVTQSASKLVNIQTASGETVLTFRPTKAYQSIVFSSAELKKGGSYAVFLGGNTTGTDNHGFYENGTYTPGREYATFTISGITTKFDNGGWGGGWGWP